MWKKIIFGVILLLLAVAGTVTWIGWSLSVPISATELERLQASPNYHEERFVNIEPEASFDITWESLKDEFFGDQKRVPVGEIPVVPLSAETFAGKAEPGLRVTWLGHASVLVEIDGYRVLTDPVFSERVSPYSSIGPKRFHPTPIELEKLDGIDAVVISHNHYDHLDKATIIHLAGQGTRIHVPLGNGGLLKTWNIPDSQIIEMDWWQESKIGALTIVATPARHYSSRGFFDFQKTLWNSWVLAGPDHRAFFSGDTGYAKVFSEIGERFGPFDIGMIKIGAYGPGQAWIDVHMEPEDAIRVSQDVGARIMLPVHWATFNLARHDWYEPANRAVAAADKAGVSLVTPRVGETVSASIAFNSSRWWEDVDRQ